MSALVELIEQVDVWLQTRIVKEVASQGIFGTKAFKMLLTIGLAKIIPVFNDRIDSAANPLALIVTDPSIGIDCQVKRITVGRVVKGGS